MLALCDVNVLLALAYGQHAGHAAAIAWLEGIDRPGDVVVCRQTQLGLLRLLNNATVMAQDVCTAAGCWAIYDKLMADERLCFMVEPEGLEESLRSLIHGSAVSPRLWQDAYLAAFAIAARLQVVTFDVGFRRFPRLQVELLRERQ